MWGGGGSRRGVVGQGVCEWGMGGQWGRVSVGWWSVRHGGGGGG